MKKKNSAQLGREEKEGEREPIPDAALPTAAGVLGITLINRL